MPFLTEVMYQTWAEQKRRGGPGTQYPSFAIFPKSMTRSSMPRLSADMEALLRLVSLGSAARNSVRIKVRQPLAEIVYPAGQ